MAAVIDTADHQAPPRLRLFGFSPNILTSSSSTTTAATPFTTLMRHTTNRPPSLEFSPPPLTSAAALVSYLVSYSLYNLRQTTTQLVTNLPTVTKMGDFGSCPPPSAPSPRLMRELREIGDFGNDEFFNKARFSWLLENPRAVGPVWDQGNTWSCWAFVVRDAVSAMDYIHNGNPSILSVQELVDCVYHRFYPDKTLCLDPYGNKTASGSFDDGYQYVYTHGLYLEEDYPFVGRRGECRELPDKCKTSIYGYHVCHEKEWKNVEEAEKYTILEDMIQACPVGAVIRVYDSFKGYQPREYTNGIYVPTTQELDDDQNKTIKWPKHAVLVIGYGSEGEVDYYVIKNSAGANWGHLGYAKVKRELLRNFAYPYSTYLKKPKQKKC